MKATVIKFLRERRQKQQAAEPKTGELPLTRTQSRAASLYSNRTSFLSRVTRKVGFGQHPPKMSGMCSLRGALWRGH